MASSSALIEREQIDEEIVSNIFNLIKDNEVDHLRQLLTPSFLSKNGFGDLSWNM
jgi:hypothetical protein